jgi:hypothetical protein
MVTNNYVVDIINNLSSIVIFVQIERYSSVPVLEAQLHCLPQRQMHVQRCAVQRHHATINNSPAMQRLFSGAYVDRAAFYWQSHNNERTEELNLTE